MTITQADIDAARAALDIPPDAATSTCGLEKHFAAHREAAEARAKLEGAKAMQEAFDIADAAPELNMSNYDHNQVDALNKAMNELHSVLKAALDPAQIAGGGK